MRVTHSGVRLSHLGFRMLIRFRQMLATQVLGDVCAAVLIPYSMHQMPVPVPRSRTLFAPSFFGHRQSCPSNVSLKIWCCKSSLSISACGSQPWQRSGERGPGYRIVWQKVLCPRSLANRIHTQGEEQREAYFRRSWSGRCGHFPRGRRGCLTAATSGCRALAVELKSQFSAVLVPEDDGCIAKESMYLVVDGRIVVVEIVGFNLGDLC